MSPSPSQLLKLALILLLICAIALSAFAAAPRRSIPSGDLRRLVISALALYLVGGLASLTHHAVLAGVVYASGIVMCALAAWLSRGTDSEDPPPEGHEPVDERPPPSPDGLPELSWDDFERAFRSWAERPREPVG